jgi:ABC-type multidrug transport system ATPase subunit
VLRFATKNTLEGRPLSSVPERQPHAMTFAIDVHGLVKSFGTTKVVDGLSLQVTEGEVCGFLGGNGSGKTTTIRLLCGLMKPDAGGGTCLGFDLLRESPRIRREVGYMPQRFSLYDDLTVVENLDFIARLYQLPDRSHVLVNVLQQMELGRYAQFLAKQLSGGWKQRLALAACVLHRPKLLLLDEPTAGVDAKARREFWDLIHEMAADGMTVLVSTHYMDEAERCQRVVYLAGGRLVVQGSAEAVVQGAGLIVFQAIGPGIETLVRKVRRLPGVETAAVFGDALRVTGKDRAVLRATLDALPDSALAWQEVPPRLDDVFIHMLNEQEVA